MGFVFLYVILIFGNKKILANLSKHFEQNFCDPIVNIQILFFQQLKILNFEKKLLMIDEVHFLILEHPMYYTAKWFLTSKKQKIMKKTFLWNLEYIYHKYRISKSENFMEPIPPPI